MTGNWNKHMKKQRLLYLPILYMLVLCSMTGCGADSPGDFPEAVSPSGSRQQSAQTNPSDQGQSTQSSPSNDAATEGNTVTDNNYRDNTPLCLVPVADGIAETHNDVASIDYSHASEGYVCANYTGSCPKVKIRVTSPDSTVYTYDLHGNGYEVFPLSSGNGDYEVTIYENISGTNYSTCLYEKVSATITDEFTPFLYPNQYVNFSADSRVVAKGAELAATAASDLEVITNIYDYITANITYDYAKASDPPTGYTSDVDAILDSGTGICLDYAAVMTSMLRSQRIPTRLEIGYAGENYHAWISTYIKDIGWVNGIIEFNGTSWTLMDPTYASTSKSPEKFVADQNNYQLKYVY